MTDDEGRRTKAFVFRLSSFALLAFALRVFRLDAQSLWYDEAFSVYLAHFDLATIAARTAADIQPPLYYFLLHFWITFAGDSEFALRFLSLIFGVLTIPLMYVTARRLFDATTARIAALIAALAPLYVWYAQETRMYTLITFLLLLSSYALWRALTESPHATRWWVVFTLANIAATYTHYFAFVVIAFQFLYAMVSSFTVSGFKFNLKPGNLKPDNLKLGNLKSATLSLVVILLAFLPWMPFVIARFGQDASYWRGALKLDEALRHILINFTMGESVLESVAYPIALGWLLVLLVGIVAWVIRQRSAVSGQPSAVSGQRLALSVSEGSAVSGRRLAVRLSAHDEALSVSKGSAVVFCALYLIVPLTLLLVLFSRNPKFNPRYLMIASPAFYLLLAMGLASILNLTSHASRFTSHIPRFTSHIPRFRFQVSGFSGQPSAVSRQRSAVAHHVSRITHHALSLSRALALSLSRALALSLSRALALSLFRLTQHAIRNTLALLPFAFVLATSAYADYNIYFDPAFTKADFRGVARHIEKNITPDEAIILTSGHLFPAFHYYYRGNAPTIRLPDEPTLNTERVLGYDTARVLNETLAGKRGVWLVLWQDEVVDPNGFVPMLLSARGTEQKVEASFWHVKLRHWTLEPNARWSSEPEPRVRREVNFQNLIRLIGYDVSSPTPADVGASFNLYWRVLDTLDDDYRIALRVVDAAGNVWGKQDRRPAGYNYPTTRWKRGEYLFGAYTVPLLAGTPTGDYLVQVTFYTQANPSGLDVLAPNGAPLGKSVTFGPIRVLPPTRPAPLAALDIPHTISQPMPPFTLLGYHLPRDKASAGETIPLTLFWRADSIPTRDYTLRIRFGDTLTDAFPISNLQSPTSTWRAGEIVRGQYAVTIPTDTPAGATRIGIVLSDGQHADLAPFTIEKTDRVFVAPRVQFVQRANFGNLVELVGYDLSTSTLKPGETLNLTLHWRARARMDKPYTVFVHVLDANHQIVAQKDAQPLNGARPTTTWIANEYLADAYTLTLKADAPHGTYRIEIGWYDAKDPSFARLHVLDDNGVPMDDHVILQTTITVRE